MQPRTYYTLALALITFYLLFWFWRSRQESPPERLTDRQQTDVAAMDVAATSEFGRRSDRGNLLGIQPWMEPGDYADRERFGRKMSAYFNAARQKGYIVPNRTVVVLPEYLGTWLVTLGEKPAVYGAKTVQDGLQAMVMNNPLRFARAYRNSPDTIADRTRYAVFAMKAQEMADVYTRTFLVLAATYETTIVAGSILLPNPIVRHDSIITQPGPLYNVTAVFRPDGTVEPQLVRKVYPIHDERPFVCGAKAADVPVFDTPVGRLGVLICADSWNSPVYQTLRRKGATLLAVPSYSAGDSVWQTRWKGYSGTPTPPDARADVGRLTEGQAWLAYAMGGRAKREAGLTKGMNVFLRGKLWDLGSDGTTVVLNDSTTVTRPVAGATLTCLWL